MKSTKKGASLNRRDFMKYLTQASALGALGSVGQLSLMSQAVAAAPSFSDYKALVCVFLYGGNDSFNMLLPTGSAAGTGHSDYASIRGSLAVANNDLGLNSLDLDNTKLSTGTGNPYHVDGSEESAYLRGVYDLSSKGSDLGVNSVMPELAQLIKDNKASVIANVGNLVAPGVTRDQIKSGTANLPLFLFAHNHQQRALQTGQGDNLNSVGWAGRIADNWSGINGGSDLGLNISYFGNDRMLIGDSTVPLVVGTGSPPRITGLNSLGGTAEQDRRALLKSLAGEQSVSSSFNVDFNTGNTFTTSDPFKQLYGSSQRKSMAVFDQLYQSWNNSALTYNVTDSYGGDLFSVPSQSDLGFSSGIGGGLIKQLEAVAKMIDLGANNALGSAQHNRQVFMVRLGGFDTHAGQVSKHPLLLREISLALWKFQKALEEKGHANKVTTFTMSDFGRTVSNNGDGTDHAWGAHHIVMGGDGNNTAGNLKGGQVLGTLPDLRLDGVDDQGAKGRIIPTLAQDQLNATLCNWFGVDQALMPTIFPNIQKFETTPSMVSSAYLNDLFA